MSIQTKTMAVKSDTSIAETTTTIRDTVTFDVSKMPNGITYKGLKAVLSFADPIQWNRASSYDSLTVVWDDATHASYASKRPVPQNIELANKFYWLRTADLDAQVEMYRQEVQQFDGRITDIANVLNQKPYIFNNVSDMKKSNLKLNDFVITAHYDNLPFSGGKYLITDDADTNEMDKIKLDNGLCATLIIDGETNVLTLGYKNGDCSSFLQRLITFKQCIAFYPVVEYTFINEINVNKNCYIDMGGSTFCKQGANTRNVKLFNIISDISFELFNGTIKGLDEFATEYVEGLYITSNVIPVFCSSKSSVSIHDINCSNVFILYKNDNNLDNSNAEDMSEVNIFNITGETYGVLFGVNINGRIDNVKSYAIDHISNTGKAHMVYAYGKSKIMVYNSYFECDKNGYQAAFNSRIDDSVFYIFNTVIKTYGVVYAEVPSNFTFINCKITDSYGINNLGGFTLLNGGRVLFENCTYDGKTFIKSHVLNSIPSFTVDNCAIKVEEFLIDFTDAKQKYIFVLKNSTISSDKVDEYVIQVRDSKFDVLCQNVIFELAKTAINTNTQNSTNFEINGSVFNCEYPFFDNGSSKCNLTATFSKASGVRFNSNLTDSTGTRIIACVYNGTFNA